MMKKNGQSVAAFLILVICVLLVGMLVGVQLCRRQIKESAKMQGYYPVSLVMKLNGYEVIREDSEYVYQKNNGDISVIVEFDFKDELCTKNIYEFSLENAYASVGNEMYVHEDALEAVLNCELSWKGNKVISEEISFYQHEWTECYPNLIAHAGGAVRTSEYNATYCNSIEALAENYNLGHRVFEFDFYLTSDNQMAVVHDWNHQYNFNGDAPSAEEWKNSVVYGQPEGEFTPMMLEELLDEMLVNKDMFVVTDTKFTDEQSSIQFQAIYDAAMTRAPELLDRIIPQIYNEEMYDIIMSIYEFPSVIYTAYATGASGDEIIGFAKMHANIKVITAPIDDMRFDENKIGILHDYELLIYNHTIQTYQDLTKYKAKGIDGFYSGLLLPRDIELYENSVY